MIQKLCLVLDVEPNYFFNIPNDTFYTKFKLECDRQNKSMHSVLEELGLSQGYLKKWKDNDVPQYEILRKISTILNVPITNFLPSNTNLEELEAEVIDLMQRKPERSEESIRETVYDWAISDMQYLPFTNSIKMADAEVEKAMEQFSDNFLKNELIGCFNYLNRRGKIEALFRIIELSETDRFRKEKT